MKAPAFWWQERGAAAALLRPAAALYGAIAARRMRQSGERAPVPVICVGNFTVGGAGKTPTALALARLLKASGEAPAFLTRGYGGRLHGPVRVDPAVHQAPNVGDEPLLLARAAPTIVSRNRPAGAMLCVEASASVILMDDGLQNPSLHKDCALAVVDAGRGVGNGLPLLAGPLRAPLSAQWPHVDGVVLVGEGAAGETVTAQARQRSKPVFSARLVPDPEAAAKLRGRRVLAFAGIGRPQKFFETLESCGAVLVRTQSFPDHHAFSSAEIRQLTDSAVRDGLLPVTTEKDWVRLVALGEATARDIVTLPVRLVFEQEAALLDFVRARLAAFRPGGARSPTAP